MAWGEGSRQNATVYRWERRKQFPNDLAKLVIGGAQHQLALPAVAIGHQDDNLTDQLIASYFKCEC